MHELKNPHIVWTFGCGTQAALEDAFICYLEEKKMLTLVLFVCILLGRRVICVPL